MDERRKEIRTMFDSIPEEIKKIKIKLGMFKIFDVDTVDISSLGMAFVADEGIDGELKKQKHLTISFHTPKAQIKAKIVYSYVIIDSKMRIGVIFEDDTAIKQYHSILEKLNPIP